MDTPIDVYSAKWIDFVDITHKTKTKKFLVINRESKSRIGEVKWYGPFRQYSYFPSPNTVYERQCLLDITRFIQNLMNDRKKNKEMKVSISSR